MSTATENKTTFDVFADPEEHFYFYSKAITRDFGENMVFQLNNGKVVFSVVMPLLCIPSECGLVPVGTITRTS